MHLEIRKVYFSLHHNLRFLPHKIFGQYFADLKIHETL